MPNLVLIADIGGTSSRLAKVGADGVPTDVQIHRNDSFAGFEAMIEADLSMRDAASVSAIGGAVLAVAAPADTETIKLTNRDWSFTKTGLRKHFGWQKLSIVNDFEALAQGVPALTAEDLVPVGHAHADTSAPMVVCGPGTGFGTAGLLRIGRTYHTVTGEGGRCRLGAANAEEARLLAHLLSELGPVVVEHAVSGSGLGRIHRIFAGKDLSPEQVIAAAHRGDDAARASIDIFLRLFGRIAGDLALIFNARGGVFLAGGVSTALAPFFEGSPFRKAFEEHPPHEARLVATPVNIINHPTPGLVGCGQLGARLARGLKDAKPNLHLV
ncbi:ROK family protein [Ancylobacter sp. MQZ15Z-1]|uniref:ROK family protein n=1 Tax=Ancylobacter mangrovi TaxID=2972472 RepID=A0A9X2PHX1_9HYPH|nr:glucokinase [Ancylobacter mangrovi]MCS0497416.1 ROK family protein [Ancylobacter mangrovi]